MKAWTSWEIIRHQVAIFGLIKDERGIVISGVQINIISMPSAFSNRVLTGFQGSEKDWEDLKERVDRTETNKNGIFYFMDLPSGPYTLNLIDSCTDSKSEKKVKVKWDKDGKVDMATVTAVLSLAPKK